MTVRILGPAACRLFIVPSAHFGINLIAYGTESRHCEPWQGYQDPHAVAAVLEQMQTVLPMGWLPDGYPIMCLDHKLVVLEDDGKPSPLMWVNGERLDGWTVLSAEMTRPLGDIVPHELTHEVCTRFVGPAQEAEFFALTGLAHGENTSDNWAARPQELLAEYVSTALWNCPLNEQMLATHGAPTPEMLAAIREWIRNLVGDWPRARVKVVTEARDVSLTIGSTTAFVRGRLVALDVAPVLRGGRTAVPLRFVAEALGAIVDWQETSRRILIRCGDVQVVLSPGVASADVNGVAVPLDVAPWIEPGANRCLVPLRFLAETFKFNVSWDQMTKTVTITN